MAQSIRLSRQSLDLMDSFTVEDLETASIRSAAPSYSSEAPSAHYTVPLSGGTVLPPYSAPASGSAERAAVSASTAIGGGRAPTVGPARPQVSAPVFASPLVTGAGVRHGDLPNMSQFRIPSWSTISSNSNARLYHSVALRRVAAAEHASAAAEIGGLMRRLAVLERMEQEEAAANRRREAAAASSSGTNSNSIDNGSHIRPLEDPYLVGETAARRARTERLAREAPVSADDALLREDRRWDWFLGQMKGRHGSNWSQPHGRVRHRIDANMLSPSTLRHIRNRLV